jgi:hypothetical protein
MFGHRRHQPEVDEVPVDVHLERDLSEVVGAVDGHLAAPTDTSRKALLDSLELLDAQLDAADTFSRAVSGALGLNAGAPVIGETSGTPEAVEVYGAEFQAQVALVKAAKDEVRGPTSDTLSALRTARGALDSVRAQEATGRPPPPRER